MTTNKDHIERLEMHLKELKEGFEKMSKTVSKSIHELSHRQGFFVGMGNEHQRRRPFPFSFAPISSS
ncbi:hypothetical protein AAC387_Pa03g2127 [Persea americana]